MKNGESAIVDVNGIYDDIWNGPVPDLSHVSDVVIRFDTYDNEKKIINLTTGKEISKDKEGLNVQETREVTRGREFVYLLAGKVRNIKDLSKNGILFHINREKDVLVIYECFFNVHKKTAKEKTVIKGKWESAKPVVVITKQVDVYMKNKDDVERLIDDNADYIDMLESCVLYTGDKGEPRAYLSHKNSSDVLREFFGQESLPFSHDAADIMAGHSLFAQLNLECLLHMLLMPYTIEKEFSDEKLGEECAKTARKYLGYELPDIDKSKIFTIIALDEKVEDGKVIYSGTSQLRDLANLYLRVIYIQRIKEKEDTCVLRLFSVGVCSMQAIDTKEITLDDIILHEELRIYFSKGEICAGRNFYGEWKPFPLEVAKEHLNDYQIILPWEKGTVDGTVFSCLDDGSYDKWFKDAIGDHVSRASLIHLTARLKILSNHVLSLVLNPYAQDIFYSPFHALKQNIKKEIQYYDIGEIIKFNFGVDTLYEMGQTNGEKKPLMECLDFPKHFMLAYESVLEEYSEKSDVSGVIMNSLTNINALLNSASEEEKGYIQNMNKEQYKELLRTWINACMEPDATYTYYNDKKNCIKLLIKLCGVRNLKSYIEYVFSGLQNMEVSVNQGAGWLVTAYNYFEDYLTICNSLRQAGILTEKPFWRFHEYRTLKTAHDNMMYLINASQDKVQEEKEKKYLLIKEKVEELSYKEDAFSVIVPDSLKDIANEGISLHHCVKSYIGAVLAGETNILFIRKTDDLEKPFYTLEVKHGTVRQCHGFGNCNVSETDGLQEFLKRYCEEKNIFFEDCDRILAVE